MIAANPPRYTTAAEFLDHPAGLMDTVRSPDVPFVAADKISQHGFGSGWVAAAPDLVVEVLSPSETAAELEARLQDYFNTGTRLAWVVDMPNRMVGVRRRGAPERWTLGR